MRDQIVRAADKPARQKKPYVPSLASFPIPQYRYRIVPGKRPPPNFDSFMVFEVLRVCIGKTILGGTRVDKFFRNEPLIFQMALNELQSSYCGRLNCKIS